MVYIKNGRVFDPDNETAPFSNYVGQFVSNLYVKDISGNKPGTTTLLYVSACGYTWDKQKSVVVFDFSKMQWRVYPSHFKVYKELPVVKEEQRLAFVPYLEDEPKLWPSMDAIEKLMFSGSGVDIAIRGDYTAIGGYALSKLQVEL